MVSDFQWNFTDVDYVRPWSRGFRAGAAVAGIPLLLIAMAAIWVNCG